MKRKNSGPAVDLRDFMERSATKKRQSENQTENQMQLVVFQGQSGGGIGMSHEPEPEPERVLRYEIVYELLKLVRVLPVATAGVERVFSSMNCIKNKLRSKMGQKYLNDFLFTFIERDLFLQVKDEDIIMRFQALKNRKVIL